MIEALRRLLSGPAVAGLLRLGVPARRDRQHRRRQRAQGHSLRGAVARSASRDRPRRCADHPHRGCADPVEAAASRWDNGRDVVLAGDAAGVVAPASGEGIYYAMLGGRLAADAVRRGARDVQWSRSCRRARAS